MGQLRAPSPPRGLVIREAEENDLDAVAALLQAADDARVLSADGLRHRRRTRPERGRMIDVVAEPSPPPGFRCIAMRAVAPEAAHEAITAAAIDEPTPVPNDDIRLDDFVREWDDPDLDLDASTAVVDETGRVAAFTFIKVVGS